MAEFVPYNDEKHREQFFELNVEYLTFMRDEAARNGHKLQLDNPREYVRKVLPKFTSIHPSEGIIYILEVNGDVVGMGALKKLEDGIGEIKRMYIRPGLRGGGLGKEMLRRLTEKAVELGYSTLRLDTGRSLLAAQHVYRSARFVERGPYSGTEATPGSTFQIFMEKKL